MRQPDSCHEPVCLICLEKLESRCGFKGLFLEESSLCLECQSRLEVLNKGFMEQGIFVGVLYRENEFFNQAKEMVTSGRDPALVRLFLANAGFSTLSALRFSSVFFMAQTARDISACSFYMDLAKAYGIDGSFRFVYKKDRFEEIAGLPAVKGRKILVILDESCLQQALYLCLQQKIPSVLMISASQKSIKKRKICEIGSHFFIRKNSAILKDRK